MTESIMQGGCLCGQVRYEAQGEPLLVALCHCSMCRRAHAAPVVAWAMFNEGRVKFLAGAPAQYASSAEAKRGFCAGCGTQISFTATFLPGLIDITVGSLDHPERVKPQLHYWDSRRLPWMEFSDGLPHYPEFPPQG